MENYRHMLAMIQKLQSLKVEKMGQILCVKKVPFCKSSHKYSSHKNLGLIISSDLSWDQHYKNTIPKTYRMLGLLHCNFSKHQTVTAKRILYNFLSETANYILFSDSDLETYNHIKQGPIQGGSFGG